jgi:hypothetical protein
MKTIKLFLLAVLSITLLTANSAAQDQKIDSFADFMAKIKSDLRLNDEQVREASPILQHLIEQLQMIMKQDVSQEETRIKVNSVLSDAETQLTAYLSAEQMKLWEEKNPFLPQAGKATRRKQKGNEGAAKSNNAPSEAGPTGPTVTSVDGVLSSGVTTQTPQVSKSSILVN